MNDEAKRSLQMVINKLKLEYRAEFVPTPQPAETVQHPQLNWRIHLKRGRKGMSVDYHEGCAHVIGYQSIPLRTSWEKRQHEKAIREACETGKYVKNLKNFINENIFISHLPQPAPDLLDVLYCLVQDASVIDCGSFEEWASDYGYDADSRSVRRTYRLCLEQSLQLRNLLGNATLELLAELYQD